MNRTGITSGKAKPEIKSLESYKPAKAKALLEAHGEEWLVNHLLDRAMIRLRENAVQPLKARIGEASLFDAMVEALDPTSTGLYVMPVVAVPAIPEDSCYHTFTNTRVQLSASSNGAKDVVIGSTERPSDAAMIKAIETVYLGR